MPDFGKPAERNPHPVHSGAVSDIAQGAGAWVRIGIIHSPFRASSGTPIQPVYDETAEGVVEIFPEYAEGLMDVEGFERIWLIYRFDRAHPGRLRVVPFRDTVERGVFATRAPARPNSIGLSCVRLIAVEGRRLRVTGVDILDGTPLLDLKPYVPAFDAHPDSRAGWLDATRAARTHADDRFGA